MTKDMYAKTMMNLASELHEWRDAGGDTLKVVGAIQAFVHAIRISIAHNLGLIAEQKTDD